MRSLARPAKVLFLVLLGIAATLGSPATAFSSSVCTDEVKALVNRYRLAPDSPVADKASDGGAVGIDGDALLRGLGCPAGSEDPAAGRLLPAGTAMRSTGAPSKAIPPLPARPPEAPRIRVDTDLARPTGGERVVRPGEDLQAAINAARNNSVLVLQAGATWRGAFQIPGNKDGLWIASSAEASLPVSKRATPAQAGLMPKIRLDQSGPALTIQPGAKNIRLVGLDVGVADDGPPMTYALVSVEPDTRNVIVDRSWFHGHPKKDTRRALAMYGDTMAVVDSSLTEVHEEGWGDTQAFWSFRGKGFLIRNNYLESAGEVIMFGGQGAPVGPPGDEQRHVAQDIEIIGNDITRPRAWWNDSEKYPVKNLLELKHALRVRIEGNRLKHSWAGAQSGWAVLFTVRQDGNQYSQIADVLFQNNIVESARQGIVITGWDDTATVVHRTARILIRNNLFIDIDAAYWREWPTEPGPFLGLSVGPLDVAFLHNTIVRSRYLNAMDVFAEPAPRLSIRDNIWLQGTALKPGQSGGGISGSVWKTQEVVTGAKDVMRRLAPDGDMRRNVFYGRGHPARFFPADNWLLDQLTGDR